MKQCVKETSRGLLFPRNIPRRRGEARKVAIYLVSLALLLAGSCFATNNWVLFLLSSGPSMFLVLTATEIASRFCALFEERKHFHSRYDNQIGSLLFNTFFLAPSSCMMIAAASFAFIFIYFITNRSPFEIVLNENWRAVLAVVLGTMLFNKVSKLEYGSLNQSLQFDELQGCDYGSGMAHSFFHGYLRIMLPHTGRGNDKGLKEFQQDYEARNGIKFAIYKLFILIPMSQNCPPSLGSEFSPSVEPSKELECKEIDRAGVKNRNYKNSVYKINTLRGDKKYVTAEYATPVKTLAEVMKQNTPCARMYFKYRKEILLNFYLTLRNLLREDEECCNLCEVIYYDDRNEEGDFRDVGEVILNRLKHIKKNQ